MCKIHDKNRFFFLKNICYKKFDFFFITFSELNFSEFNEFQCSESCGTGGLKRRSVHCVDLAGRKLDTRYCEAMSHDSTQTECNRIPCPEWAYGPWGEVEFGFVFISNKICPFIFRVIALEFLGVFRYALIFGAKNCTIKRQKKCPYF
jgi:hypothetical protein